MLKFKLFFVRNFFPVALFWWRWWSKLYRFLFQQKYKKVMLMKGQTPATAYENIKNVKWVKDGPKELWDVVSSPHWGQYVINALAAGRLQPEGAFDCDDFAIWMSAVIGDIFNPQILSVVYTRGGAIAGHALCLVRGEDGTYAHISNWGLHRGHQTLNDVVKHVLRVGGADAAIVWAVLTPKTMKCWFRGKGQ